MDRLKTTVSPLFQERLKQEFRARYNPVEKTEQNCLYRFDLSTPSGWVRIKQFSNGTLYLEGTDNNAFQKVAAVIADVTGSTPNTASSTSSSITPASKSTAPSKGQLNLDVPYIGTDESGKGDYFGPLVIAGVYTAPELTPQLKALGVCDSKQLTDGQMKPLAQAIKNLIGDNAYHIIEISPKRYNELYDSFKARGQNLNHLLAWGHAKVLECLLEKNPTCTHAIADQFGSEHYIRSQLQTRGKQIQLYQTHKAEANIGVAAASILARVRFVEKLHQLGTPFGLSLPPGANAKVSQCAQTVLNLHGPEALGQVAKLHFKTTQALTRQ